MTLAEFTNVLGFKVDESDVRNVNQTFSNIKNTAGKLLGAIGIGFSLIQVNSLVEEFTRIKDQIKNSTEGLGEQAEIQEKILKAATETRSAYFETANMVSNLVKENSELFGNVDAAIEFNNAATMLFKSAGKTNEDIATLMEAINKSFAKGYIDSETLSQLLERSPEAVELLNKKLGTTSDQLEQMATDGKFTVKDLRDAFVENADEIEKRFLGVRMSVTDAIMVIRNKWGLWLSDANETLEVTDKVAHLMVSGFDLVLRGLNKVRNGTVWLSEKLGGVENMMKLLGLAAAAYLSVFLKANTKAITGFLTKVFGSLKVINLQMLKSIAIFLLLALIVEDFIAFMCGEDSLFGTLLEKAGIDADKFRERIFDVFENIKMFLLPMWKGFCGAVKEILGDLGAFWDKWGGTILKVVGTIVGGIATVIASIVGFATGNEVIADILYQIGGAIGGIITSLAIFLPLMKGATSAFAATKVAIAFLTSPIGHVILIIVALIAVLVLLVKNWDKIKDKAKECWEKTKDVFRGAANWFKTTFIDPVVGFFTDLYNAITGRIRGAMNWIQENWPLIISFILNPFGTIFQYLYDNFEGFRNFVDNVVNSVKEKVSSIKEKVVEEFNSIEEFIKSIPEKAFTWGSDIISSMVDGIRNGFDRLRSAASDAASVIKSFIGFSEPETGPLSDFHTYMPDMIALMTQGIREGRSRVREAVADVAGDMMILSRANIVSGNTAAVVKEAGNRTTIINQNNNFSNHFEGDRAIQRKAAGVAKENTKDVTAELARALAFAR